MARFLIDALSGQAGDATSVQINISGILYGTDVPGKTLAFNTTALVLFTDTGAQADAKIQAAIDAVIAGMGLANSGGYKVTYTKV